VKNDHALLRKFIEAMIIGTGALDTSDDEDLSAHLEDASTTWENDYGPVPPSSENDPYVMTDPFVRDLW